jgi:hypothetical protein
MLSVADKWQVISGCVLLFWDDIVKYKWAGIRAFQQVEWGGPELNLRFAVFYMMLFSPVGCNVVPLVLVLFAG